MVIAFQHHIGARGNDDHFFVGFVPIHPDLGGVGAGQDTPDIGPAGGIAFDEGGIELAAAPGKLAAVSGLGGKLDPLHVVLGKLLGDLDNSAHGTGLLEFDLQAVDLFVLGELLVCGVGIDENRAVLVHLYQRLDAGVALSLGVEDIGARLQVQREDRGKIAVVLIYCVSVPVSVVVLVINLVVTPVLVAVLVLVVPAVPALFRGFA